MTLVVDATLVVAALLDSGPDGVWADSLPDSEPLDAPHLMPVETVNILRRSHWPGGLDRLRLLGNADLLALRVELFPYEPFAERIWDLRDNITAHDAWYVALAESLDANLGTLDTRLSRAPGSQCTFQTPPR